MNFLSTGNSANTVLLDKSPTTLIVGRNGEGKSTILDALCFALFGKPFRNINKGQLVNSINQKNCMVEIKFSVSSVEYRIRRGIKPNLFEIYQNDVLMNQDSANRDYQKILEQQILRLNYKTFTQVVILGSASFVPFMQLPSTQRREVIEDILDIKIFSTMNQLLKEKAQETKDAINRTETEIKSAKDKVESQQAIIKTITEAKTSAIENIRTKISANSVEILSNESEIELILSQIDTLKASINDKEAVAEDIEKAKSIKSNKRELGRFLVRQSVSYTGTLRLRHDQHSKRVKLCEHQSIIGGADHMFTCLYIKVVLGVVAACARATHVGTALLA
jgi:DNA repair exonuclease SbcCD ATPase subunit